MYYPRHSKETKETFLNVGTGEKLVVVLLIKNGDS